MKLPHRSRFLHLVASAAALPAVSRVAWAQAYGSRPVRIIIGFPAGTTADIIARLLGQWLSERLGQPFLIEDTGAHPPRKKKSRTAMSRSSLISFAIWPPLSRPRLHRR